MKYFRKAYWREVIVLDLESVMGCCCSVGSKARLSRTRRHMTLQTEFLQMNPCAWAFEPLQRHHGHPWAWWTSQNTHGHSWECLELGECPLLGSLGKQCISHSFGLALYSMRDPGGNTCYKTVHSLYLLSHTSTLCCFPFSREKSTHFLTSCSSPDRHSTCCPEH